MRIFEFLKVQIQKHANAILAILVLVVYVYLFRMMTYTYVTAEFPDLRPVHHDLAVYYKGIKVGKTYKMNHARNYTVTQVHLMLFPRDLHLPENTAALMKIEKKGRWTHDYFELTYPEKPVEALLSNGDIISGKTMVDLETYLANQDPESLDEIKKNLVSSTQSLNTAFEGLTQVFVIVQDILSSNKENIQDSTKNLAKSTENINKLTNNVTNALSYNRLNSAAANIDESTKGLRTASENINTVVQNIDGTTKSFNNTLPKIDNTLAEAQCIVANVNEITSGVKCTLRKRMGGFRLIFGQPINPECRSCKCK